MILSLINQLPKEFGVTYNIATRTINFNLSGGEFVFKSSDRPDSLRGEGLDLLVMDEAAFHKKNVWSEILRPALADRKGSAIFISTPNPKKNGMWFEQMFKDGQNSQIKNMKSWQLSSYLNPYLDPEEIDQIREVTPDSIFRREYLAQFVSDDTARIARESIQYIDIDELKDNKNLAIAIGADLAISEKTTADYTAIACVARDLKTGNVYVLDIYRDRLSFARQKDLIKGFADKWNRPDLGWPEIVIGIENVNYQAALVQEVSREVGYAVYGIPSTKDKIARFAPLEAKYELKQVYHVEGLPLSFENELLSFPEGENDDYEDAMEKAYKAINIAYGFTSGGFTFDLSEKDNVFSF
jgi:predicted phage terminase large subunit-like protein